MVGALIGDCMDASSQASTTPGSFTDLYPSIAKWTLAQDVALLDRIDQFSRKVASRTEATSTSIQNISNQFHRNRVRLHSAINSFNSLSNTQFIESRVREDDSHLVKKDKGEEADLSRPVETAEQKKMRELKEAIVMTQAVMRDYFNVVEVNIDESDDEEDSHRTPKKAKPTFREAKDPYLHRPLPYIIGTEEFNRDRYIGLRPHLAEEALKNGTSEDEVVLTARFDDLLVQPNGHSSTPPRPESPTPQVAPVIRKSGIISSESEEDNASSDIFTTRSIKDSSSSKPSITPSPTGVRLPQPPLTRSSSQASSAKTGNLFADDEEDESDLFSTKKIPLNQANQVVAASKPVNQPPKPNQAKPPVAVRTPSLPSPSTSKPPPKKVSIFAEDNDEEDSAFFSSRKVNIGQPITSLPNEEVKKTDDAPISNPDKILPSTPTVPITVEKVKKKKATLFDDDGSDEEDLFTLPSAKPTVRLNPSIKEVNQPTVSVEKPLAKTQLPAVSSQIPPLSSSRSSSQSGSLKARNLFLDDGDDDDDLFSNKKAVKPKTVAVPVKTAIPREQPSLVGIPQDKPLDSLSGSIQQEGLAKKMGKKAMLFDDEDSDNDDLFALPTKSTVNPLPNQPTVPSQSVTPSLNQSTVPSGLESPDVLTGTKSTVNPVPNQPTVPSQSTVTLLINQSTVSTVPEQPSVQLPPTAVAITPRPTVSPRSQPSFTKLPESLPVEKARVETVSQLEEESDKAKPRPAVRARSSLLSLPNSTTSNEALPRPEETTETADEQEDVVSEETAAEKASQPKVRKEDEDKAPPEVPHELPVLPSSSPTLLPAFSGNIEEESLTESPVLFIPQSSPERQAETVAEAVEEECGDVTVVSPLEELVEGEGRLGESQKPSEKLDAIFEEKKDNTFLSQTLNLTDNVTPSVSKDSGKAEDGIVDLKAAKKSALFDDDNSDEDLFAPASTRHSIKTNTTASSTSASVKSSSVVSGQSKKPPAMTGGLFEDDSEDEDLFSIKPSNRPIKPVTASNQPKATAVSPPKVTVQSPLMEGPPPLDNVESSESDDDLFH